MERDPHREEIKATPYLWTPWTPWGTRAALRAAKSEEARMAVPVYEAGATDAGQAPN